MELNSGSTLAYYNCVSITDIHYRYRQSLELVESAAGSDHPRVAQELSALVKIARKTGRRDYANQLQLRVISITKRNGKISLVICSNLSAFVFELYRICLIMYGMRVRLLVLEFPL